MITDKYRRIVLSADGALDGRTDQAIATVNKRFDPDDFFITRTGDELEVWMRQIDLAALSDAVSSALAEHDEAGPISQIIPSIESIKSYGLNGNRRLYIGYNKERKMLGRKRKERRRGKHYYANDHEFSSDTNLLPDQYIDQVVCGDSEAVLKRLPSNCVDLVFTSPPYNFGLDYQGNAAGTDGDAVDWESYFANLFRILDECIRVLKFGGRIVINVQPLFSDYIPSHHIVSSFLMKRRLIWKGEILWEKNNYNCKYTAWGSWKSPSSPYLKYTWEFLEVFCKGDLRKAGQRSDIDIDADSFKEWVVARWSIAPERRMREFGHPAMFPEELARRVMLLFSFRGDIVLDPFAGVGTTCVAARRNMRHFLGIDISPDYCSAAEDRLADVQAPLL